MSNNIKKIIKKSSFILFFLFVIAKGSFGCDGKHNRSRDESWECKKALVEEVVDIPTAGCDASVSYQRIVSVSEELAITTEDAALLLLLNDNLFHLDRPTNPDDVNVKAFSPTKPEFLRKRNRPWEEVQEVIAHQNQLYPLPIQDQENFPPSSIYSPAARKVKSRIDVAKAIDFGKVKSLPLCAFEVAVKEETEEERALREERQRLEFEKNEATFGNFSIQLSDEREIALRPWVGYFRYVDLKIEQGQPLIWQDLAGAFLKYVAPTMKMKIIGLYKFHYDLRTIKFERQNKKKMKNHEIMPLGRCPIGVDGESMHHHHVFMLDPSNYRFRGKVEPQKDKTQVYPYSIALIPAFIHENYRQLHPTVIYEKPAGKMDRGLYFDPARMEINQKLVKKYYNKM